MNADQTSGAKNATDMKQAARVHARTPVRTPSTSNSACVNKYTHELLGGVHPWLSRRAPEQGPVGAIVRGGNRFLEQHAGNRALERPTDRRAIRQSNDHATKRQSIGPKNSVSAFTYMCVRIVASIL